MSREEQIFEEIYDFPRREFDLGEFIYREVEIPDYGWIRVYHRTRMIIGANESQPLLDHLDQMKIQYVLI